MTHSAWQLPTAKFPHDGNLKVINTMSGSKSPCQLRYLSLACMHDKATDKTALAAVRKCPQVQRLDLTYCENITGEGGYNLISSSSDVGPIDGSGINTHSNLLISMISLTSFAGLISIFRLLPALEDVSLRRCTTYLTDAVLSRYALFSIYLIVLSM